MPQMTEAYGWGSRTVVDRDGARIGKIDAIYLDRETDEPEWALVNGVRRYTSSASRSMTRARAINPAIEKRGSKRDR